uniref:Reverse transcriptase Ty1/copia-type domain-containing protein n=1 Tax=Tanacetum cinerariifolium TaxID=118510 RepID=A0A6L2MS67_TANCI|nr:hypothetical protein [Tanacetum cinerariifolium]
MVKEALNASLLDMLSILRLLGIRDEVSDQQSYCFNIEDDPKTFDKAVKSQDVAFWKKAINDEMDSILGNNTWVLADLPLDEEVYINQPLRFIIPGKENKVCKLIKSLYGLKQAPKKWHQKFDKVVDLTKEFLSSRFSMKDMGEDDVILDCTLVSARMDTSEKLMPNNGQVVSQLEYSRVIGCLMYAMICTRPNIAFAVGYTDASWICNTEDNSSTSGWGFLLGGRAISWASKKQTCTTGSTIESEFVAL